MPSFRRIVSGRFSDLVYLVLIYNPNIEDFIYRNKEIDGYSMFYYNLLITKVLNEFGVKVGEIDLFPIFMFTTKALIVDIVYERLQWLSFRPIEIQHLLYIFLSSTCRNENK